MPATKSKPSLNSLGRSDFLPWIILAGLVVIGFSSRLLIADLPNFKPIAAIALFSGFYFRRTWMALLATALALLISDWQIGSYHWPIALSVYGCLLTGAFIGRYFIRQPGSIKFSKFSAVKTGAAALMMSCLFFAVTNFAVWASGAWYSTDFQGLTNCYTNAVPFFKYTLAGDCFFSTAIFGSYALAAATLQRATRGNRQSVVSAA